MPYIPIKLQHIDKRTGKPVTGNYAMVATPAQAARGAVSRENRQEYDNEKRAWELDARMPCGHRDAKAVAIAKMMCISESHAKKLIDPKRKGRVILDGKID